MNDSKRIFAVLLCAVLLGIPLISCGQKDTGGDEINNSVDTETQAEEETGLASLSAVPDLDFGGASFTVACRNTNTSVDVEEMTGEAVNDAVYTRNRTAEEYLNFRMDLQRGSTTALAEFSTSFLAGETLYSAAITHITQMTAYSQQGYFFQTKDIEYLDLQQPYWAKGVTDSLLIDDKTYLFSGDICITDDTNIWCIFFNKELLEDLGLESPYTALEKGYWTLDFMAESAAAGASDLNGDGAYTWDADQFAVLNPTETLGGMYNCMDRRSVIATDDGGLELMLGSEASMNVLQAISDWASSGNGTSFLEASQIKTSDPWADLRNVFIEGRGLYYTHTVNITSYLRDMEDEYGILPMPKYTEEQENYISSTQEWGQSVYGVPVCAPDREMSGAILEYLGGLSTNTIRAAYYDSALTRKYTRDSESVQSLDILFNNIVIDIGFAFNFGSIRDHLTLALSKGGTLASTVASIQNSVETAMNATLTAFQELN